MAKKAFENEVDVLKYQREKINSLDKGYSQMDNELDEFEKQVQGFIKSQNIDKVKIAEFIADNKIEKLNLEKVESEPKKNFNDLINQAHQSGYSDVDLYEIATIKEIDETNQLLNRYYSEFTDQYKLDKYDYAISGIIGTIAALIDYFLVTNVDGKKVVPGELKSGVEEFLNKLLSEEKVRKLEFKYKVTYDISLNSSKISQEILGLCPLYHRFQSLGHDPIIGFIFGVADLMKGQLTAIDGNGRLIIQSVKGAETKSLIEAVITVFGHFLSDVGTKSKTGKILSVPVPLTPLLQLIQKGSIEYKGQKFTVADLSKKMYHDGYNFNHFIGMSLPVLLIEILTRLSFVIKEMFFSKKDVSIKDNQKLTIMLCIANGILFAENVGKLALTKNPFAINCVSWITTAKYGFNTLKWVIYDREMEKVEHAQGCVDTIWKCIMMSANELDREIPAYYIE